MDCLEAIRGRYSCRSYSEEPVSDDDVRTLCEAAFCAPSANNARPWHIVVVRDADLRARLSRVHQWAGMCAEAPVVLAMCGDVTRSPRWWVDDTAAATQNVLLAAHAVGLGTCWVGIHAGSDAAGANLQDAVREILSVPPNIAILGLIAVGHPRRQAPPRPDRYAEDHVHQDGW